MEELDAWTMPELAAGIRQRRLSARELVAAVLARIDRRDGELNAVVALDAERVLAAAADVDEDAVADPDRLPPYAGVPTLVKDLNHVAGLPTTFGAQSMADFVPPFDDESVSRMKAAGLLVVGKTNVPEVGSVPWTEPRLHGPTRNPCDPRRTAGGSSGGAAAAVAAGYVPAAHGSDGGGSIRIPAGCCGVVGLKPGRGRVSNGPLFGDLVLGLVSQGPIARRVVDVAALLDAMHGPAPGDPQLLPPPARPFTAEVGADPGRRRIGVVQAVPWARPDDTVRAALDAAAGTLSTLGHDVAPLDLRVPGHLMVSFTTLWAAAVAANPLPHDRLEPHNQAFAARGRATSAAVLLQAHTRLQQAARSLATATRGVDAILGPVLMTPPPLVGAHEALTADPDRIDELIEVLAGLVGITPLANVTGQAAITLPLHRSPDGLPIGVQLVAGMADEWLLIRLAAQVEATSGWGWHGDRG